MSLNESSWTTPSGHSCKKGEMIIIRLCERSKWHNYTSGGLELFTCLKPRYITRISCRENLVCLSSSSIATGRVVCWRTLEFSNSNNASSGPGESGGVAMIHNARGLFWTSSKFNIQFWYSIHVSYLNNLIRWQNYQKIQFHFVLFVFCLQINTLYFVLFSLDLVNGKKGYLFVWQKREIVEPINLRLNSGTI